MKNLLFVFIVLISLNGFSQIKKITVYFDFDKYKLKKAEIQKMDAFISKNNLFDKNVRIEGYADKVGTESYNDTLSEKRAIYVKKYLKKNYGINCTEVKFFGESRANQKVQNPKDRKVIIYFDKQKTNPLPTPDGNSEKISGKVIIYKDPSCNELKITKLTLKTSDTTYYADNRGFYAYFDVDSLALTRLFVDVTYKDGKSLIPLYKTKKIFITTNIFELNYYLINKFKNK